MLLLLVFHVQPIEFYSVLPLYLRFSRKVNIGYRLILVKSNLFLIIAHKGLLTEILNLIIKILVLSIHQSSNSPLILYLILRVGLLINLLYLLLIIIIGIKNILLVLTIHLPYDLYLPLNLITTCSPPSTQENLPSRSSGSNS